MIIRNDDIREQRQWEVVETGEYEEWFESLDAAAKEDVLAKVKVLVAIGPTLGRPQVDTVKGSRFPNMKELRVKSQKRPYRIFFAFDPKRRAILLIGGSKGGAGDKDFYAVMIPIADRLFAEYLENLKDEKN